MDGTWPSWVEVRLDHLVHNVRQIKSYIGPDVRLCAVVKANGYGHGAVPVAWAVLRGGASCLGVGSVQEGIELRQAGILSDILVLGGTYPDQVEAIPRFDLIQGIQNEEIAVECNRAAQKAEKTIRVHVKVDTGMGRLGIPWEEFPAAWDRIRGYCGLRVEGIYSHFAESSSSDKRFSEIQMRRFEDVRSYVTAHGDHVPLWHFCNSGGILQHPKAYNSMVRGGLLVYGWSPANHPMSGLDLRPVLTWKSRVLSIKTIRKGESVSYGRSWIAEKDEQVAVVPVGYHDGYDRGLSPAGQVLVEGQRASVVGDVCMDNMVILITGNPKVRLWSEVVLMGSQGNQSVTPMDMAGWSHTIPWEVLCRIGRRIPRVYCWKDKKIARFSFLDSVVPTRVLDEAVDAG